VECCAENAELRWQVRHYCDSLDNMHWMEYDKCDDHHKHPHTDTEHPTTSFFMKLAASIHSCKTSCKIFGADKYIDPTNGVFWSSQRIMICAVCQLLTAFILPDKTMLSLYNNVICIELKSLTHKATWSVKVHETAPVKLLRV